MYGGLNKMDKLKKALPFIIPPLAVLLIMGFAFYRHGLYPFGDGTVSWCDMSQQVIPLLTDFKDIFNSMTKDDYIIIFMFFDFGQVICIQNILCDQKVDTEVLADFLHGFRVLQSVYLYPVDAVRLKMRNHFVNIFAVAVVYPLRIIRAEVKMSRSLADSRIVQLLTKQIVLCHSL